MNFKKIMISDVVNVIKVGVYLYIPFLFLVFFGKFYIDDNYNYLREVVAFGLQTSIYFVLIFVLKKPIYRKKIYSIGCLLLSFFMLLKLSFYTLYQAKISASILYVIFETNATEIVAFISDFINGNILFLVVLVLVYIYSIRKIVFLSGNFSATMIEVKPLFFYYNILKLGVLFLFLFSGYKIYNGYYYESVVLSTINAYTDYQETKEVLKNTLSKEKSDFVNVDSSDNTPKTYIVIIGESTTNTHMQLYGYNRETNPKLTEIKEELLIFKDVISPNIYTIWSLVKVLTLSNYENPDKKENTSIIQLANQAGFTTFWLSNQRPIGHNETIPTLIGTAANHKTFVNTDNYEFTSYDGKLLYSLDNALSSPEAKKIIFIHLMGAHGTYRRRYLKEFDYFKGINPTTTFKHEKSKKLVNEYDNAVRYNDYIVRAVIDKMKALQTNSYVLYFSDHGEELFDNLNVLGHNEHRTNSMYEIPFIVWLSDTYKEKHPIFLRDSTILNRKYNLEDFMYSFSDISNIKFDKQDETRSVFNKNYVQRKRLVRGGVDYDERK